MNDTAHIETVSINVVNVKGTILKSSENTDIPNTSPVTINITSAERMGLKGIQILTISITPVNDVIIVAMVEICSWLI